ncbi:MAG: TIGR00730 family Rossman fold protein [Pseudomonadota bacterium]
MAERPMICLYCGSRPGHDAAFAEAAVAIGQAIAARGWGLVYGAGDHGLMGLAAQAAMEGGAPVLGFIPRRLVDLEVAKRDITAMVITETMHERKKLMLENADAVLALPGGAGTLDELVEALTWRQLGITRKPVVLLDTKGYWQPFAGLIGHFVTHGFAGPGLVDDLCLEPTPEAALNSLAQSLAQGIVG